MRVLLTLLAIVGAYAAGVASAPRVRGMLGLEAPPPMTPVRAANENQSCRDDCEQRAIVESAPEAMLRLCIARCNVEHPLVATPRETPRSISVAPADHRASPTPSPR